MLWGCGKEPQEDWIQLFNGKDLDGWKANETTETFKVVDGVLIANGLRSHLFYVGNEDTPPVFKNFELAFDVMTHHLANSGVYFHTAHQKDGWLETGYELQVNSTHRGADGYVEVKKGGSLYGVRNLYKAFTKDSVWHKFNLRVDGKRIQIKIDDQLVVDYTEPSTRTSPENRKVLSSGTFALQGHDPESTVYFKNIRVKRLPDNPTTATDDAGGDRSRILDYQANHFAFIDYNIPVDSAFDLEKALRAFYNSGINVGLTIDVGSLGADKADQALSDHIKAYKKLPVFLGILKQNNVSLKNIQPSTLSQFDYIIGDLRRFKNRMGREIDIINETQIGDPNAFMDDYVEYLTDAMDHSDLDIWALPTVLPKSLSGEYDKLWTPDRMAKVIDAVKRNDIAIEVNNVKRIPSIAFLKLAKEKGCHFTTGGLYAGGNLAEPDYFFEVIDQCGLDYRNVYVAGQQKL
jgi:hypothetical protein